MVCMLGVLIKTLDNVYILNHYKQRCGTVFVLWYIYSIYPHVIWLYLAAVLSLLIYQDEKQIHHYIYSWKKIVFTTKNNGKVDMGEDHVFCINNVNVQVPMSDICEWLCYCCLFQASSTGVIAIVHVLVDRVAQSLLFRSPVFRPRVNIKVRHHCKLSVLLSLYPYDM